MRRLALIVGACIAIAGCTKHNPDSCCVTSAQCTALGLDQMYPCDLGKVCDSTGTCIAPQCATSADCADPISPVCVGQLCVAACVDDGSCTGLADTPYCAEDGECVACRANAECMTAEQPICDSMSRSCRGCTYDAECPSGPCLEAVGTCIDESRVIYVANNGTDSGTCTKLSPCATVTYAMSKADNVRNVIHISTPTFGLGTSTITIGRSGLIVDGTDTMVIGGSSTEVPIAIPNSSTGIVLQNIRLTTPNSTAITVGTSGAVTLFNVSLTSGVEINAGTFVAQRSTLSAVDCMNGTADLSASVINGGLMSTTCQFIAKRNWFENGNPYFTGGTLDFENNVLTGFDCGSDAMNAKGMASGSKVHFNTFVCTSDVASDGVALFCDSSVDVSSNIFAWNSMHPFGYTVTCHPHHSLFDPVIVSTETSGTGNVVAERSTFFANFALKDFHLSAASPARGAAQTGLNIVEDYDQHPRPNPAGSTPDIGAFEAP